MSDDLKVDWGAAIPINGVKPDWLGDGCQVDVLSSVSGVWYSERAIGMGVGTEHIGWSGVTKIRLPADHPYYQIASYKQPDMGNPITDDLAKRMEALVREMAKANGVLSHSSDYTEARAIVALLPEPVDADLVEARKLVGDLFPSMRNIYQQGEWDCEPTVQTVLAAIRRGRALERDSREG